MLALGLSGSASAVLLGRTGPPSTGSTTTATTAATTVATTTTTTVTTTTGNSGTTFLISGHGWGHGIGMSQWGAYGYAKHGFTYDQILAHYYPGTTLGPAPVTKIRVLLTEGKKSLKLSSTTPWRVLDGTGTRHELAPGTIALGPGLKVKLPDGLAPEPLEPPLSFIPGAAPLALDHPYRGTIQVTVAKGKLQAVDIVPLEAYLKGVVPSEMPSSWAPDALEAQAVAARSYALSNRAAARAYDVYADTRSQVYGGVAAEKPQTNAAVDATAGQVLLYNGQVASTLFSSSSGGRTAAVTEVFAGAKPVPYLVSVPDPYDTLSPYHDWGPVVLDASRIAKALKAPGQLLDLETVAGTSGRVKTVTAVGTLGQITATGSDLRRLLDLRSTWFTVGLLSLTRPSPIAYGSAGQITGVARGVSAVTLQQRAGVFWQNVGPVAPTVDGTFSVTVRPTVTTPYRLLAGTAAGATISVPVAPVVRFGGAGGTVNPVVGSAVVEIQRQDGTAWTTIATAPVDASGSFAAAAKLTTGAYRARYAPGNGLVAGVSPVRQIA